MKKLLLIAAVLLGGCASRAELETSAKNWAAQMGLTVTGVSCTNGCNGRCSVHVKRQDGGSAIVALACDESECRINERSSDTTVIYAPSGR